MDLKKIVVFIFLFSMKQSKLITAYTKLTEKAKFIEYCRISSYITSEYPNLTYVIPVMLPQNIQVRLLYLCHPKSMKIDLKYGFVRKI